MKFPKFSRSYLEVLNPVSSGSSEPIAQASSSTPDTTASLYDSATDNGSRSSFVAFPLTARREITRYNRVQTLRKIRALEANFGLIGRLKTTVGKYAVGRGVFPQPKTKDTAWNAEAKEKFDDWANNRFVCDVAGAMTFWERQRFHAEALFGDGESFDALVSSSVSGAPQLQLFDCSEVGNPYYGAISADYADGVKVSPTGRPIEYQVVRQIGTGVYPPIETFPVAASDMIHIIRRKRANQYRGISPFAPSANCAVDSMDLRSLITASAKLHEAMGLVVKKKAAEAGKGGISNKLSKDLDSNGKVTQITEGFTSAAIQYLAIDEAIEIVASERPSQNLQQFLTYLIRDICSTTGLPSEIVWDMAQLGGAPARIVLADAQWFFDGIQDLLNEIFNQRVWVWWCASMMKSGQLSKCSDPRWWTCDWQGPPKLTADAGRAINGDIDALGAGLTNWENYHDQHGRDWKDVLGKRIAELKWAQDEAKKAGVPFEYLYSLKPGVNVNVGSGLSNVGGAE